MSSEELNFMTMGDEGFANTIICSTKQIAEFYPDATVYVYDWGLDEESRSELDRMDTTIVVDWHDKSKYNVGSVDNLRLQFEQMISGNMYTDHLYSEFAGLQYSMIERRKDFYMCQKPQCILDCAERVEENLFFIDGDAVILNQIDDLFDLDFDVGVTLRPKIETALKEREGKERFLNAGIIFFKCGSELIEHFVTEWLDVINSKKSFGLREQRSLTHLVQKADPDPTDNYYRTGTLALDSPDTTVITLPCEKYNYYWIDNGFDVGLQKILHFKDGLHNDEIFKDVITSIENGNAAKWGQDIRH